MNIILLAIANNLSGIDEHTLIENQFLTMAQQDIPTRCNVQSIEIGHHLSRVSYVKVIDISPCRSTITVKNQDNLQWTIDSNIVAKEMVSAHQVNEEQIVSRSDVVKKLMGAGDSVFTVQFSKKVDEKIVSDRLQSVQSTDLEPPKKRRALAKELLTGETRTLVGYLFNTEPEMGRSRVVDLQIESTTDNTKDVFSRTRLVDHRTVNYLILNRVKYVAR